MLENNIESKIDHINNKKDCNSLEKVTSYDEVNTVFSRLKQIQKEITFNKIKLMEDELKKLEEELSLFLDTRN